MQLVDREVVVLPCRLRHDGSATRFEVVWGYLREFLDINFGHERHSPTGLELLGAKVSEK
jgi:hypothetical protein